MKLRAFVVVAALAAGSCTGGDGSVDETTATWSRASHDEAVFGGDGNQVMDSVAAAGPGLVAVGADFSGGDSDAAVWTSSDGMTWTRVPHDEAVFGGDGNQEMLSVAAAGTGLVAVGNDRSGSDSAAAVWASSDGITWSRVSDDEAVFGGDGGQGMVSVAAAGPGVVAVGHDWLGGDSDVAVWTARTED